jgi:hypothetical protein
LPVSNQRKPLHHRFPTNRIGIAKLIQCSEPIPNWNILDVFIF